VSSPDLSHIELEYRRRLERRRAALGALERRHLRFSQVRLAIAAAGAVILIAGGLDAAPWLLLPFAAFVVTAVLHARLLNRRDQAASAVAFYDRNLDRIAGEWAGRGRTGELYRPADHRYAADLDLFGTGSLFELLSTARTSAGEETLARWLLDPAAPDTIRARQGAVRELMPLLDLRESVAVMGDVVRARVHVSLLRTWALSPRILDGGAARRAIALLAVVTAAAIAWLVVTGGFARGVFALLIVQAIVGLWYRNRVHAVAHAVDEPSHDLDVLAGLLAVLEREQFASPLLERLRADVKGAGRPASLEIARLSQWVALLSSRENLMFALPASLLMWGTQWAFAIERWRARMGPHLGRWLDAVGELEALMAFATFAAEHPDYIFPEIVEGPAQLHARGAAHPLLPPGAVANDVALGGDSVRLLIVSGSNMSGKSTLLRTIGVNTVLAQAGAPVRAAGFRLSPLAVGGAITIQDSLAEGRSRFYAEIRRLKQIVDLARAHDGCALFLLDEILGGTNSHDRRIGAEALLRGLVADGAIGLATTHDLAIGEIVDRIAPLAANVHFEDHFEDGTLAFDYRLHPGIVQSSNALALMRSIGLEI
jgi:hypothetical protein